MLGMLGGDRWPAPRAPRTRRRAAATPAPPARSVPASASAANASCVPSIRSAEIGAKMLLWPELRMSMSRASRRISSAGERPVARTRSRSALQERSVDRLALDALDERGQRAQLLLALLDAVRDVMGARDESEAPAAPGPPSAGISRSGGWPSRSTGAIRAVDVAATSGRTTRGQRAGQVRWRRGPGDELVGADADRPPDRAPARSSRRSSFGASSATAAAGRESRSGAAARSARRRACPRRRVFASSPATRRARRRRTDRDPRRRDGRACGSARRVRPTPASDRSVAPGRARRTPPPATHDRAR